MKKIVLCFMALFLLSGCSSNKTTITELNHEELMKGNFSSIAGEYFNSNDEIAVLNNDGLREGEITQDEVYYSGSIYQMNIRMVKNEPEGGYTLTVYPVGEEIENLDTDTSKVRISYGQASPMSEEEIYTKK